MTAESSSLPAHGNAIYPWNKWTNGKAHKATQGVDFEGEANKFRNVLLATAKRMGRKVTTRVKNSVVWFQFAPAESPKPKKPKK